MQTGFITTTENFVNGIKKIYASADGYGKARLEDVYNNEKTQEQNHLKIAEEAKKMFGFTDIHDQEKINDTSFKFLCNR